MMTIKKKRLIITIIVIILFVIIGGIALIILSQNTNLFKSQDTVIKEYLGQVVDRFFNSIDFNYEEQIYNSLNEKIYESNVEIVLNDKKKDAKLKLISDSQVDNIEEYSYNYTKLSYGEENIAEIEYLKQDEIMGIRFKDLIKQYVSIKNEDLDELVQKIDSIGKEKYSLPEKLYSINILQSIKISDEEEKILKEKYIDLIVGNINLKEIKTEKNATVTVGKDTLTAKLHIIEISKKELDNLFIKMLESLKTDEILLSKISDLEGIYNEIILNEQDAITEYYINMIDKIINNLKNSQEDYKIKINIYSANNSVIKFNIEHELRKINIELNNHNEIIINDVIMGEIDNAKQIVISKKEGDFKFKINTLLGEEESEFSIEENILKEDENIKTKISILYNKDEEKALHINNNIVFVDSIEDKYDIEENNIILNELEENNLNKIVNRIVEVLKAEYPKRLKILQKGLDKNITADLPINEEGKTESEKNIFNAKFEFYAGEKILQENVQKLLEVIKQNLKDIEVIKENINEEQNENSQEEIKQKSIINFKIEENANYQGNFEEIEGILQLAKSYKVEIKYNSNTELVEYVIITPNTTN